MTGQYPHTHGIVHNVMRIDYPTSSGPATEQGIFASDVTYDQILNRVGYATHHYGKWHLSGQPLPYYPDQYGEHREYAREMQTVFNDIRKLPREEWMTGMGGFFRSSAIAPTAIRFPPMIRFVKPHMRLHH